MKIKGRWFWVVLLALVGMTQGAASGQTADVARMTVEELKAHLDAPDVVILDVRADGDWKNSGEKIRGAVRENPKEVQAWAAKYAKDKRLVLYCA